MDIFSKLAHVGFSPDGKTLLISVEDDTGVRRDLHLKVGLVAALVLELISRMRELSQAQTGRTIEEQPLQLVDASALSFETGVVGLLLQLESDLRFPLAVDRRSLTNLRSALASCDELMARPDNRKPVN